MIIVKVQGGLGNQMFQYALYRSLMKKGRNVKLDIRAYKYSKFHYGYELNKIFNVVEEFANDKECKKLGGEKYNYLAQTIKKLHKKFFLKNTHLRISDYCWKEHYSLKFIPKILEIDCGYLDGFWQAPQYFSHIEDIVRKEFQFKIPIDKKNQAYVELIQKNNSVSIHIRRGDYLKDTHFCGAFGTEYYLEAIKVIEKQVESVTFFVFSDDIDWCKENIKTDKCYYVDVNQEKESWKDMQLMSLCKHNIIANSTFSWWAAWLNTNKDKIVIAPKKWTGSSQTDCTDIIPKEWIRI